ncbi:MAG: Coenzyme F420 hydrogenase/dehydrogenase, beta subunit C-terminal domain, partial [Deltaproteobacteria bacterium]|nr:Coenzyme F420 hydrogenase/dehydrogenase, beta subunit C-terminal domain [Deltaproteobacteria bacterium]
VLAELLATGMVDGVIHMKPSDSRDGGALFSYAVSTTSAEILRGAKSKYYPMELSEVLALIRKSDKRYALVGVPCFIKAVRRLMLIDSAIAERVKFCIGLVCGHLKSKAFADCFAWQAGIPSGQLEKIDFRVKLPERKSSDYGVRVAGGGVDITRATREFFGSNWGHGFFKYSACEYCDDVFAETADISVGDAWLPEYTEDSSGNSIIVTRSKALDQLIKEGVTSGRLSLKDCSADEVAESQAGGLRHRRDGLSYRLHLKEEEGAWAPQKRVPASSDGISSGRKKIYFLRETLRQRSHKLWAESVRAGDFALFQTGMKKLIRQYNHAYAPFSARIAQKIKWAVKKLRG